MKKNIFRNIAPALLWGVSLMGSGVMVSSCADDTLLTPDVEIPVAAKGQITLNLECSRISTRATEAAVDALNENLIQSVIVCLYPTGGDRDDDTPPVFMQEFTGLDATGAASVSIPLTEEMINRLFMQDASSSCRVFAAVNVPLEGETAVGELRRKAISSEFADRKVQPSFAMDGDGIVTYSDGAATGTVSVRRSAAKVTLHLAVDESVTEVVNGNTLTWTPLPSGMKAWLVRGVEKSTLDPAPAVGMEGVFFDSSDELEYGFGTSDDSRYPFVLDTPFYTYPNLWSDSRDELNRTYMMLMVPWTSDGGQTFRTSYYQVPVVPLTRYETVRNTSYHVKLHVSVLGTVMPSQPKDLEADWFAADWGEESIDVDINDYRYLVVDRNDYVVNNETSITIPFYTTHPAEVVDVKMTFYRYNFSDEGTEFAVTVNETLNANSRSKGGAPVFEASFDNKKKSLTIKHELKVWQPYNSSKNKVDLTNGDGPTTSRAKTQTEAAVKAVLDKINYFAKTEDDEYSRVEFVATVRHIDEHRYSETVRITQYPGIYITAVKNNVQTSGSDITGNGVYGNTIINGNTTQRASKSWDTSIGLNSASYLNWNPNMYLVTVTQLPKGTKYTIGDPRSYTVNNTLSNASMTDGATHTAAWSSFIKAKALGETANRTLKNYYPTVETSTSKNVIAPKFRICSSYAGTTNWLNRENARRRAAAYQEMGYPAGRWRLPTQAEVEFVMELSQDYKIPRLFGHKTSVWYYWCAQGAMSVPGKSTVNGQASLSNLADSSEQRARFVYDEWYWGSETLTPIRNAPSTTNLMYDFTWGDKPKTNPEK